MPIVGTAGHVDHGKSTLIAALTGRDPDRWAEEKERGLTIDLGFAWSTLADGTEVGFVDVPGHERFMKNMLAGVGGIDVALLVVAADEGWMPQSEEHLGVLDLLGIRHGVVALTRIDLVDDDLAELAALETAEQLEGTTLEDARIVPVSAVTGAGLDELRAALGEALAAAGEPRDIGRPRLWVDRAFVISGAGLVVTGTLLDGSVAVGDQVALWPDATPSRVRSIQSHEAGQEVAAPGSRTALNLVGVDRPDIERGSMVGAPGQWRPTTRALVDVRAIRGLEEPLGDRGAYHLHVGSAAVPVRMRIVERGSIESGADPVAAVLSLQTPLPLTMGDRFVLREVGRKAVVGGGVVLDPDPDPRTASATAAADRLRAVVGSEGRANALLELRGTASLADLAAETGGDQLTDGLVVAGVGVAAGEARRIQEAMVAAVQAYQEANPLRPGMPRAQVIQAAGTAEAVAAALFEAAGLHDEGSTVRTADFAGGWGPEEEAQWEAARATLLASGLAAPRASSLELNQEAYHALLRDERLVRIDADLVYLPEQIEEIKERVMAMDDGFTVAQFRDALGLSRRQAVPLLEWLDGAGVTRRQGDVRVVRR